MTHKCTLYIIETHCQARQMLIITKFNTRMLKRHEWGVHETKSIFALKKRTIWHSPFIRFIAWTKWPLRFQSNNQVNQFPGQHCWKTRKQSQRFLKIHQTQLWQRKLRRHFLRTCVYSLMINLFLVFSWEILDIWEYFVYIKHLLWNSDLKSQCSCLLYYLEC